MSFGTIRGGGAWHRGRGRSYPAALTPPQPAAAVFDMDGTLVDSEELTRTVIDGLLAGVGLPPEVLRDEELHGVTWGAIVKLLADRSPLRVTPEELADAWLACWRAEPPPPVPGAPEALRAIRAAGLRVALATSSDGQAVQALLERPAFADAFDATVCADDIERSKPDPQIFQLAAERLQVAPERCLAFEDSLAGLRAARAAGMITVAVLLRCADPEQARRLADHAIIDFTDLPPELLGTP